MFKTVFFMHHCSWKELVRNHYSPEICMIWIQIKAAFTKTAHPHGRLEVLVKMQLWELILANSVLWAAESFSREKTLHSCLNHFLFLLSFCWTGTGFADSHQRAVSALSFWCWVSFWCEFGGEDFLLCFVLTLQENLCVKALSGCFQAPVTSSLGVIQSVPVQWQTRGFWLLELSFPRWVQPSLHCPALEKLLWEGPWLVLDTDTVGKPWVTPAASQSHCMLCLFYFSQLLLTSPKILSAVKTAPLVQLLISCLIVWTSLGF